MSFNDIAWRGHSYSLTINNSENEKRAEWSAARHRVWGWVSIYFFLIISFSKQYRARKKRQTSDSESVRLNIEITLLINSKLSIQTQTATRRWQQILYQSFSIKSENFLLAQHSFRVDNFAALNHKQLLSGMMQLVEHKTSLLWLRLLTFDC